MFSFEEITKKKEKPAFHQEIVDLHVSSINANTDSRSGNVRRCYNRSSPISISIVMSADSCNLDNISKAAKLLAQPPLEVHFENEHDMRKVYSLIYDVFRYKVILLRALHDVSFFVEYPQLLSRQKQVLLILFDLNNRKFSRRYAEILKLEDTIYREAEINDISKCLWNYRVRLAASISRMRIVNSAYKLSELLPVHLQNEKVAIAAANHVISGWINPFILSNKSDADRFLQQTGLTLQNNINDCNPLNINGYIWDTICPLFISCFPQDRNLFTKSKLMVNNIFVMQDRTFSFGPAFMSRLLDFFEMDGDILQTHISSPRSTAYLASLFYSVNRLNCFFVFGAGSNLKEYKSYMENLGITNIRLYAESFTSISLESNKLGTVVGIFANPPNSYSAISDPIDLICSRGGDLRMLEILTESEISQNGKHRVTQIMEEQLATLQLAMSRPQIQFILYQTHSIIHSENHDMVNYCKDLVHHMSLRKHQEKFKELRRLQALAEAETVSVPSAASNTKSPRLKKHATNAMNKKKHENVMNESDVTSKFELLLETQNDSIDQITIPSIDEFIFETLPDICLHQDKCLNLKTTGCFFSLLRRKQLTRLNAQYLIKMAESRGLFGKNNNNKYNKQKLAKPVESAIPSPRAKHQFTSVTDTQSIICRLTKPTNASFIRSNLLKFSHQHKPMEFNLKKRECCRYFMEHNRSVKPCKNSKSTSREQMWWKFAFDVIRSFQKNVGTEIKTSYCSASNISRDFRSPYPISLYEIHLVLQ